jgi:hypothetical protein
MARVTKRVRIAAPTILAEAGNFGWLPSWRFHRISSLQTSRHIFIGLRHSAPSNLCDAAPDRSDEVFAVTKVRFFGIQDALERLPL